MYAVLQTIVITEQIFRLMDECYLDYTEEWKRYFSKVFKKCFVNAQNGSLWRWRMRWREIRKTDYAETSATKKDAWKDKW